MISNRKGFWMGVVVGALWLLATPMTPLTWPLNSDIVFRWENTLFVSLLGFGYAAIHSERVMRRGDVDA